MPRKKEKIEIVTFMNQGTQQYPFAQKEAEYRRMDDCTLLGALHDSKQAWENQEGIEKKYGPGAHSGKNSAWRADDFHTIIKVINEKKIRSPTCRGE